MGHFEIHLVSNHRAKLFQLWLNLIRIPLIGTSFNLHVNVSIGNTEKL